MLNILGNMLGLIFCFRPGLILCFRWYDFQIGAGIAAGAILNTYNEIMRMLSEKCPTKYQSLKDAQNRPSLLSAQAGIMVLNQTGRLGLLACLHGSDGGAGLADDDCW